MLNIHEMIEDLMNNGELEYDVNEYLDMSQVVNERFKPDDRILEEYQDIKQEDVLINISVFTRLKHDVINNTLHDRDYIELEKYRMFPKDFLKDKGIFYSENIAYLLELYDYIKDSTLYCTNNLEAYVERYMLCMCLPNGDVLSHMGFRPPIAQLKSNRKYDMPSFEDFSQGSLLGNMESIEKYPDSKVIYCSEGMFDAYRAEQIFKAPSIALLGSLLSKEKRAMLYRLKEEGYTLIYIPDQDTSGERDALLEEPLFDNIMYYSTREYKDFDEFCRVTYLNYIQSDDFEFHGDKNEATCYDLSDEELEELDNDIRSSIFFVKNQFAPIKGKKKLLDELMGI